MSAYLLAAEADKIQDILFRSSRLREVVGGSQLLNEFCEKGAELLLGEFADKNKDKILINDGGAFRVVFVDEDDASAKNRASKFADALKEFYRCCLGGTISVAGLVEYNETTEELFSESIKNAQKSLRTAKHQRIAEPSTDASETISHLPYAAFCTSCGIALADFDASKKNAKYMCTYCWHKMEQRDSSRNNLVETFIEKILEDLKNEGAKEIKEIKEPKNLDWAESIGTFDSRNYVAYLLADGNSMGKCFDSCTSKEMLHELSASMADVARQSLSLPTIELFKNQNDIETLPVLPLILGGDDIFALLPAPWALDFAAKFCTTWEEKMQNLFQNETFKNTKLSSNVPTVSAAIVICKSNYPYMLAHRFGENLLKSAKAFSRWVGFEGERKTSAICFGLISGNEIGSPEISEGRYRSTLEIYLANDKVSKDFLPISELICHRKELMNLPGKRRNELKELYGDRLPKNSDEENAWNKEMENLLNRIKELDSTIGINLEKALKELGHTTLPDKGYWKDIAFHHQSFKSNGLSDLLTMWDYTFALDQKREEYEG